jgi:hypothetical protein
MHAAEVLQKCMPAVFRSMHAVRAQALIRAVQALLNGRRLILMELARSWPGAERVRAPLKCLDRLLSNPHLARERETFYAAMLQWLIRHPRPLLLIDWSELHADCRWQLLRASMPLCGRAFTVFEMVFPESQKGSPRAEKLFLKRLHALLPTTITPILVTDAGFRVPWFRAVSKLGWYFVGRLRGRTHLDLGDGKWLDNRHLHALIDQHPKRVREANIAQYNSYSVDLVMYRKPKRHRKRLSVRRKTPSTDQRSLYARQRESEPWILVVSPALNDLQPRQVTAIYSKRMQIEQSFRDLKCDRFGAAFYYSQTRDPKRIAILLLLHLLATFVAWLAALSLALNADVRYGGVISKRPRRYYSLLRIGWEALQRHDRHCTQATLRQTFYHPPSNFLTWLNIPSDGLA